MRFRDPGEYYAYYAAKARKLSKQLQQAKAQSMPRRIIARIEAMLEQARYVGD